MKKKMLAAAIASALAVPSAFAAIDDAGMKYTSASEGFYGSFRFGLFSGEDNDFNTGVEGTRLGVQGDVDVGHGNTAFYRLEWEYDYNVDDFATTSATERNDDGDLVSSNAFRARLGYAGLRGNFGSVRVGRMWSADYDYVFSLADVTNNVTGNFAPRFRVSNAIRYDSPDIQGFNFSIQVHADDNDGRTTPRTPAVIPTDASYNFGGDETTTLGANIVDIAGYDAATVSDAQRALFLAANPTLARTGDLGGDLDADGFVLINTGSAAIPARTDPDDGNDFDRYILAAGYSIRGVNLGVTYVNQQAPDSDPDDKDSTTWGLGGTYGQDNWKVGYNYGDTSDAGGTDGRDRSWHAVAGQVGFDKVTLRAVYETRETERANGSDFDHDYFTLEAQYSFSSKARAYANYQNNDNESVDGDSDTFYVAYRVDF